MKTKVIEEIENFINNSKPYEMLVISTETIENGDVYMKTLYKRSDLKINFSIERLSNDRSYNAYSEIDTPENILKSIKERLK